MQIQTVVFSPGGDLVAAANDGTFFIWETSTGKLLFRFDGTLGTTRKMAFSSDGKYLATVSYDSTVRLWMVLPR
jgi:WD40 repeat protein